MPDTDPLAGLDDVDWAALPAVHGSAAVVPALLRALVAGDAGRRGQALGELWETVWHQGTVYGITPVALPFLVRIVADHRLTDGVRAETALLVASAAAASSFVEGDSWFVVGFARADDDPVPAVELDRLCRERVAEVVAALDPVLAAGPPLVRVAAVAVAATVATALSADARSALAALAEDDEDVLAAAATITLELADGAVPAAADLAARAALDAETADFLGHIPSWPVEVQAVEVVRELCERTVAARLEAGAVRRS